MAYSVHYINTLFRVGKFKYFPYTGGLYEDVYRFLGLVETYIACDSLKPFERVSIFKASQRTPDKWLPDNHSVILEKLKTSPEDVTDKDFETILNDFKSLYGKGHPRRDKQLYEKARKDRNEPMGAYCKRLLRYLDSFSNGDDNAIFHLICDKLPPGYEHLRSRFYESFEEFFQAADDLERELKSQRRFPNKPRHAN